MKHPLLQNSFGNPPRVLQDDVYPEGIVAMDLAEEAGTLLVGTANGQLLLLDHNGEQLRRVRGYDGLRFLQWSPMGNFAVVAQDGGRLVCLDHRLTPCWDAQITGEIVGVCISPFGSHIAFSTESSQVQVVTTDRRQVSRFQTQRPIDFLSFLWQEQSLICAAEFGHLSCHALNGDEHWNERIMNNVGNMAVSGDGSRILLSAFNHGVQLLNGRGRQKGSFMVDGIPDFVAVAASKRRLIARTIEHRLYWMTFEGEVSWGCDLASDPPREICIGPLADHLFLSTQSGRLLHLAW
ncbi:MAG: hypothetical protein Fues2KO_28190 [Fuerstiella sp.]